MCFFFRRVLRLQSTSRFCKLGDLSNLVGWKHQATVKVLEEKRKVKSKAFYAEKKKAVLVRAAEVDCDLQPFLPPAIFDRARGRISHDSTLYRHRAPQAKAKASA